MVIVYELNGKSVISCGNVRPRVVLGGLRVVGVVAFRDRRLSVLGRDLAGVDVVVYVALTLIGRLADLVDDIELLNFDGHLNVAGVKSGSFRRLPDLHAPIGAFAASCQFGRRQDNNSTQYGYE